VDEQENERLKPEVKLSDDPEGLNSQQTPKNHSLKLASIFSWGHYQIVKDRFVAERRISVTTSWKLEASQST
jgi:hypothetical protein